MYVDSYTAGYTFIIYVIRWYLSCDIEGIEFRQFVLTSRAFNCSVNIPESYDFRSQLLLLNIIFQPSFFNTLLPAYMC